MAPIYSAKLLFTANDTRDAELNISTASELPVLVTVNAIFAERGDPYYGLTSRSGGRYKG